MCVCVCVMKAFKIYIFSNFSICKTILLTMVLPWWLSSKQSVCMRETQKMWVPYLGWEDPLEEGTATHSRILAWIIPLDRGGWWAIVHSIIQSWARLKPLSTKTHSIKYSHYGDCLLRNLYAGQEATVNTRHGATDWFQIGKG